MILYSGPLSLFSAKTRIAIGEKGLEHELIQVGWNRQDRYVPHHPEVVRLNPKCQVPVLVDDDVVVYDSTLIGEYLEERYPEPPLFPTGAAARARCRKQEAAVDEIWFPHIWDLIETRFYPTDEPAAAARGDAAQSGLREIFATLDEELAGRDFYCDGVFSVADIAMSVMMNAAVSLGAGPPEEARNIAAWSERVQARPAVAQVSADLTAAAAAALAA